MKYGVTLNFAVSLIPNLTAVTSQISFKQLAIKAPYPKKNRKETLK